MAREVLFGILVKARAGGQAAFEQTKKSGSAMGKAIQEAAEKAKKGLSALGSAATGLNQGMELVKKAAAGVHAVFELTVGKTLEQRKATDGQRQSWERMVLQLSRIQGLIGDILLPLLLGVADAFKPTLDATEKWLGQNRALAGSKLIDWLSSVAKWLVSGIATGVVYVTRVWSGWKQIVSTTQGVVSAGFAKILEGVDAALGAFQRLATAFGKKDLADGIAAARAEVQGLGKTFQDSSDEAIAAAAREAAAQDQLERKIGQLERKIEAGIGVAGVKAFARLQQAADKVDLSHTEAELEAMRRAHERSNAALIEGLPRAFAKWADYYNRLADLAEKQNEIEQTLLEYQDQKLTERADTLKDVFTTAYQTIRDEAIAAFDGIGENVDGHVKTLGEAFGQLFKGLGKAVLQQAENFVIAKGIEAAAEKAAALFSIEASAAEGGAKAVAAHAGIPFVGLAIGLGAAAAIVAAILAYAGAFHSGGVVGGRPGEESFGLLKARELVVDEKKAPAAIAAGFGPGGVPRPSSGSGGGRVLVETILPSRVTVDATEANYLAPSRARRRRLGAEV